MGGKDVPYCWSYVALYTQTKTLSPTSLRSLTACKGLDVAQGVRDSRLHWPYLFPEEQDLLREYLGEALWCEERERLERLEPGEDLSVLLYDSLREHGLAGELGAGDGDKFRFFSSEQLRHKDRHALKTYIFGWSVKLWLTAYMS